MMLKPVRYSFVTASAKRARYNPSYSMSVLIPNRYQGKLIVVEGIDGSGKSTQLSLLSQWLRSQGICGRVQRMEFLPAGQADHAARQEEGDVHSHHLQPDPRHRFRRPAGGIHTAAAAGRSDRLRRPLRLHRLRPRRGARRQQQLGAQSVPLRHPAERRVLLSRSARCGAGAHPGRARRAEILRSRHGPRSQPQHRRELPHLPGPHSEGVRRPWRRRWAFT